METEKEVETIEKHLDSMWLPRLYLLKAKLHLAMVFVDEAIKRRMK